MEGAPGGDAGPPQPDLEQVPAANAGTDEAPTTPAARPQPAEPAEAKADGVDAVPESDSKGEAEGKAEPEDDGLLAEDCLVATSEPAAPAPSPPASQSPWVLVNHPDGAYYIHTETGESRWELPEDTETTDAKPSGLGATTGSLKAWGSKADVPTVAPPKPSVFALAQAAVKTKAVLYHRKQKEVEWIRAEFVHFERAQQAKLQAEVERLEGLIAAEEAKGKSDLESMLSSLAGLSKQYEQKQEEADQLAQPERRLKALWGDYQDHSEHLTAVLVAERERQAASTKERVERAKVAIIKAKVAKVQATIAARRADDDAKLAEVDTRFTTMVRSQQLAWQMARACVDRARRRLSGVAAAAQEHASGGTGDWVELFDEERQLPYFFNNVTQESSWTLPEDLMPVVTSEEELAVYRDAGSGQAGVEESEHLAEEWITQDEYEYEQKTTAALEDRIKELEASLESMRASAAQDTFAFLADLLEEEEKTEEEQIDDINKDYGKDLRRLTYALTNERERQMTRLKERLEVRKAQLEAAHVEAQKQLEIRRLQSKRSLRELHMEASARHMVVKTEGSHTQLVPEADARPPPGMDFGGGIVEVVDSEEAASEEAAPAGAEESKDAMADGEPGDSKPPPPRSQSKEAPPGDEGSASPGLSSPAPPATQQPLTPPFHGNPRQSTASSVTATPGTVVAKSPTALVGGGGPLKAPPSV